MRKFLGTFGLLVALVALMASSVSAYTLNADGTGFVGKGEVQTALGLNNQQLQTGSFAFTYAVVSETTWTCSRTNLAGREVVQERSTETTTSGIVSSTARERNQITGFNLTGFSTSSTTVDGPVVGSCPSGSGAAWTFDDNVETNVISDALYVNGVRL